MKVGRQDQRYTAICASNPETIVVRGKDLCADLIGRIGFTDYTWLLITGELPTPQQRSVLDSTLLAIAEHGLVPSVVAARMTLAAGPEALQGAVAAGLLGCGSVLLGSAEVAGRFLHEIVHRAQGGDLESAARAVVAERRAQRKAIPGFGHPLHAGSDPRAKRLLEVAAEQGTSGRHVEVTHVVERVLPELTGKTLALNVSGAIPAVLLDAGYPLGALKGVPLLARTAGLIAHLLEEQQRSIGFILAHEGSSSIAYDGAAPEGFVPGEDA
ncbi:MAG TPA: citryl-CoA lyase [Steroidobacteraceae bacterium]|nr:citryl-CoA lyase [Steroidobacteraceae bacterium]